MSENQPINFENAKMSENQPAVRPPPCPQQSRGSQRDEHTLCNTLCQTTHISSRGFAGFVSQRVLGPIGITPTACMNHLSPPQAALTCHPLLQSGVLGAFLCEIVSVAVAVCLYSFPGVHCQVWDPATFGVACSVTSRYCLRR